MIDGIPVLVAALVALLALATIGMIVARLYRRATKETAYVRTGFGGQRVIMDGGALVFPVLHEVIPVNMNTIRLEVRRSQSGALITHDRMRVDVAAEFYVRVKPTEEAIADAAQTLGRRTLDPEALKELVEGKFVDALRAVAAEMAMEDLHEQRVDFVQKVQSAVSEDLLKNGLELETVSLTSLDQTDRDFFNPNNAFDAQGLTRLTEEIEARRKQRNDIERDTEVAVQQKNLDTERESLEIRKQEEYAELAQQQAVETERARQTADIAREQADQGRLADEARITAEQQVEQTRIASERAIEEQRIDKERQIREADIERLRRVETAEVDKRKSIELTDQDRHIAIAEKSRDQSVAEADRARAEAVDAEEAVVTVRENAKAERQKRIELVEARKQAEREAISVTVAADAEKLAAVDQAEALRLLAEGNANEQRIGAQAEADAERARAEAARVRYEVEAEGKSNLHQAENLLSNEQIAMRIKLALIENLDRIIAESVKPMEAIEGIKIVQVDGLAGAAGGGRGASPSADAAGAAGDGNLADQAVNAALRYRAQAPLLDSLLKEVGIDGGDLNGLTGAVSEPELDLAVSSGNGAAEPTH